MEEKIIVKSENQKGGITCAKIGGQEKEIRQRISELEKELQSRQQRLQQAQAIVQQDTQAIISTNGGLVELKRLLKEKEVKGAK